LTHLNPPNSLTSISLFPSNPILSLCSFSCFSSPIQPPCTARRPACATGTRSCPPSPRRPRSPSPLFPSTFFLCHNSAWASLFLFSFARYTARPPFIGNHHQLASTAVHTDHCCLTTLLSSISFEVLYNWGKMKNPKPLVKLCWQLIQSIDLFVGCGIGWTLVDRILLNWIPIWSRDAREMKLANWNLNDIQVQVH